MLEAIGWVANKDGHGANPANLDTFHFTTDIRTYLETNGANSLGTSGASNQTLLALVRTNNVNLNSLPVGHYDSQKKLTFATTRFDDGFQSPSPPNSGITAYRLWLRLGSFEDSMGGGGYQPGRIIYQTANDAVYATTEDAGGNITITNDMSYSAVIVESVQDEISEEWYLIITSESGTFDNTKILRSRQNGIRHNKQTHIYDTTGDIGTGIGYYKYPSSATGLGTASNTRGPIERFVQYAKYNVDRDGNVINNGTEGAGKPVDSDEGLVIRNNNSSHFASVDGKLGPTRVGYVDDVPQNGTTTNTTFSPSNTSVITGNGPFVIMPKDLEDVSAPTTHTPTTRSNEIKTSDLRGAVYPFKYQCKMFLLGSQYYQKFTTLSDGSANFRSFGSSGVWYDLPAINSGFLANNLRDQNVHRDGGQTAGQLPRFDIPYDTPNPTAFKISTTEFKAEIAGDYDASGSPKFRKHYMNHVAHPGICIVRSKVFESTNPDDYTEIVAVSRDMTKKSWGGGSSVGSVGSADDRKLCTIPAMSYIIEKPGSYVVTYITKFLRRNSSGDKLVYINRPGSLTSTAGKALTQEQLQPIVTFETI